MYSSVELSFRLVERVEPTLRTSPFRPLQRHDPKPVDYTPIMECVGAYQPEESLLLRVRFTTCGVRQHTLDGAGLS